MLKRLSLKQARLVRGKTQNDLAKYLKIHVQTYRKLEEKPQKMTIEQAQKICKLLDFSYNDIFFAPDIYQK